MTRLSFAVGTIALLLLSACNQMGQQQAKADNLAPHPLAGSPATASTTPPKAPPAADLQAAVTPPSTSAVPGTAPPSTDDPDAQFEQQALAEIEAQAASPARAAIDFDFKTFDGKAGKLSKQFGTPLVVNFWAPWCPPCRAELPDFKAAYDAKPGRFKLLGICGDDRNDPPGFVKQNGYDWQFAYEKDFQASKAYDVQTIPRTLFINRKGQVVIDWSHGPLPRKAFEAALSKIS